MLWQMPVASWREVGCPPRFAFLKLRTRDSGARKGGRRASAKMTSLCHLPQQVLPGPAVHSWMSRSHFSAGGSSKKRRFLLGSGSGKAPKRNARTTMSCGFCEPPPTFFPSMMSSLWRARGAPSISSRSH